MSLGTSSWPGFWSYCECELHVPLQLTFCSLHFKLSAPDRSRVLQALLLPGSGSQPWRYFPLKDCPWTISLIHTNPSKYTSSCFFPESITFFLIFLQGVKDSAALIAGSQCHQQYPMSVYKILKSLFKNLFLYLFNKMNNVWMPSHLTWKRGYLHLKFLFSLSSGICC